MNEPSNFMLKSRIASRLLACGIVLLTLGISGTSLAQDYVGAEYCAQCHPLDPSEADNFAHWRKSGHRFILQEGAEAQHRPLHPPAGKTWDDISYVVGGYATKAIFLDENGYIVTSTVDPEGNPVDGMNQWNLLTGEWSDFHPGEEKSYDCGRCHTTGYRANGSMPGLPGIEGAFEFPGVECEVCHGPGNTMAIDHRAEACGTCHKHPDTDGIEAVDGFVRSEGQYSEFKAGPHAELACISCHNPHKSADYGIKQQCEDCHSELAADYATTFKGEAGIECEDCHMPWATLSAQPLGPHEGDRRTHIFTVDTRVGVSMFTEDGTMVKLDDNGKAAVTLDFVCQRCHGGKSIETRSKFATDFHDR
jgi:hypothetical protein